METAAVIFTIWSAAIFAVLRSIDRTPLGDTEIWARLLPVLPMAVGAVSGPTVVPLAVEHLDWLTDVDTWGAVAIGIGAGAVAASGHSSVKQTIRGRDRRIRGSGVGGKIDLSEVMEWD